MWERERKDERMRERDTERTLGKYVSINGCRQLKFALKKNWFFSKGFTVQTKRIKIKENRIKRIELNLYSK